MQAFWLRRARGPGVLDDQPDMVGIKKKKKKKNVSWVYSPGSPWAPEAGHWPPTLGQEASGRTAPPGPLWILGGQSQSLHPVLGRLCFLSPLGPVVTGGAGQPGNPRHVGPPLACAMPPAGWRRLGSSLRGAGNGGGGAAVRALQQEVEELRCNLNEVMQLLRAALGSGVPGLAIPQEPRKQRKKTKKMTSRGNPLLLGQPANAGSSSAGDGMASRPGAMPGHGNPGVEHPARTSPAGSHSPHLPASADPGHGGGAARAANAGTGHGAGGANWLPGAGNPGSEQAGTLKPPAGPGKTTANAVPAGWKMVVAKPRASRKEPDNAPAKVSPTSAAPPGQTNLEDQPQPVGPPVNGVTLPPAGWSVPVLPSARDLQAGGKGVALATVVEAMAAKTQLRAAAGSLAVLLSRPVAGATSLDCCISRGGKLVVQKCYLLQLGSTPVTYAPAGTKLQSPAAQAATEVIAIAMSKEHVEPDFWKAAELNPVATFTRWLVHHEIKVLDTFKPQREGAGPEARITALARIPMGLIAKALNASGADGVFTRTLGTPSLQVVWLEKTTTRKEAWGIAQRHKEAVGLVLGRGSLGVRCTKEEHSQLTQVLLGKDAMSKSAMSLWQITGLPLEAEPQVVVETIATSWPWEAKLIRAYAKRGHRHLLVKAPAPPPACSVLLGDWLLAVAPAETESRGPKERVTFTWQKPASAAKLAEPKWTEEVHKTAGSTDRSSPQQSAPVQGDHHLEATALDSDEDMQDGAIMQAVSKRLRA